MTTQQDFFNVIFFDTGGKPVSKKDHEIAHDVRSEAKRNGKRSFPIFVPANGGMWKWDTDGTISFQT